MKRILGHAPAGCRRALIEGMLAEPPRPGVDARGRIFCTVYVRPLIVYFPDGPVYPGPDVCYTAEVHGQAQRWLYARADRGTPVVACGFLRLDGGQIVSARIYPAPR